MLKQYFKRIGAKRMVIMLLGNVFLGMGVSIFKLSEMGTDPFSGMVMALAEVLGIGYPVFLILVNLVLLFVEVKFGRDDRGGNGSERLPSGLYRDVLLYDLGADVRRCSTEFCSAARVGVHCDYRHELRRFNVSDR